MPVAHLNWAYLRAPWGHPDVAGFCDSVGRVNAAAARSPGFIARAELSRGDVLRLSPLLLHTGGAPFDPERMAATLSVWESARAVRDFATLGLHGRFLARRAEWFVPQGTRTYVLWPVAAGHRPGAGEAKARMRQLIDKGPSAEAFDFGWLEEEALV